MRARRCPLFRHIRQWNLALILAVTPEALPKPVTHPERGAMTFQVLIETMAGHDLNHIRQIEAIRARYAASGSALDLFPDAASALRAPPRISVNGVIAFVAGVFIDRTLGRDERIFHGPDLVKTSWDRRWWPGKESYWRRRAVKRSITCRFSDDPRNPSGVEIGGVHHQRVAFPMADRIAQPLADARRGCVPFIRMMRTSWTISTRIMTASGVCTI